MYVSDLMYLSDLLSNHSIFILACIYFVSLISGCVEISYACVDEYPAGFVASYQCLAKLVQTLPTVLTRNKENSFINLQYQKSMDLHLKICEV